MPTAKKKPATPSKAKTTARKPPKPRSRRIRAALPTWLLVRTKGRQERYARLNAEKQGFTVYVPRWAPKGRGKLEAMFPGYIFVEIQPGQSWAPLRSTYGILDVVAVCPLRYLTDLWALHDDEGIIRPPEQAQLSPGDKVQEVNGAFKNHVSVYIGAGPGERVVLLMSFMGKSIKRTVKRHEVVPIRA